MLSHALVEDALVEHAVSTSERERRESALVEEKRALRERALVEDRESSARESSS